MSVRLRPPAVLAVLAFALYSTLAAAPARASSATITIGTSLVPATLTVAPSTTVTWTNADGDRHRIRTTSGPAEFDSRNLEPGERFSVTLTAEGTYAYRDERNVDRSAYWGTIVVSSTPVPPPTAPPSLPPGVTPAPTAAAPSTATVRMADRVFRPATVSIAAGGSVRFVNDDDRSHTATSTSRAFDSGTMAAGSSYTRTFPAAGTFAYLCLLHPDMTGTVVVKGTGGSTAPTPVSPSPAPTIPVATPEPTLPPGATQPPPTATAATILDFAFSPDVLRVTAGSTITWRNAGIAPHTVTADDGSFDSGMLQGDGTFTQRFDAAGTIPFYCVVHPDMTGTVVVSAREGDPLGPGSSAAPVTGVESSGPPGTVATARPLTAQGAGSASGSSPPEHGGLQAARAGTTSDAPLGGALPALLVALVIAAAITLFGIVLADVPGMSRRSPDKA